MQGADDCVAPATAAERPEQFRIGLAVDPAGIGVRGHDLDRLDPVTGKAVAAAEPAQSAAERVAGDADVG